MEIRVYRNSDEVGKACALLFASEVLKRPNSVLGFATGSTPIDAYKHMIAWNKEGRLDMGSVTTFNLDEYCGLSADHDQSYAYFMHSYLFKGVNLCASNINFLSGTAPDYVAECERYEQAIADAGGIDMQLLGIGHNGHIAFNEPGDYFPNKTHRVALSGSTIEANKRFFQSADEVPRHALSMGVGSIMRCNKIVLVATGEGKAKAVANSVNGPITPMVQASILQLHPDCVYLMDEAAAAML